jgi:hypothetical protein
MHIRSLGAMVARGSACSRGLGAVAGNAPGAMSLAEPVTARVQWDVAVLRFWAAIMAAIYLAFLTTLWRLGYYPYLPDFSVFWAAGKLSAAGHPAAAYDWSSIARFQAPPTGQRHFGRRPFF